MRILLVTEFFPTTSEGDITGGVEASIFFLARELAKKHKVTVLCSFTSGSKKFDHFLGYDIHRVGPKRNYTTSIDPSRILYIFSSIYSGRKIRADIVMGTNFISQIIAYQIGKAIRIPVVLWTPDVWLGEWFAKMANIGALTGEFIERYNLSHRDVQFIAISKIVSQKMQKKGVSEKSISVIPCGVDFDFIQRVKAKKYSNPTLCVISRLVHYKKLDILINSLSLIVRKEPFVKLHIIGKGPEESRLRLLTNRLGIRDKVRFLGFKHKYKEVVEELKKSHIFVSPSTTEGFGIATMEAMAVGIPVVLVDMEVNREITGGKGGMFFKPDNPEDLANKVINLLDNKKIYNRKSREALIRAKQYDWSKIALKIEKLFKSL